MAFKSLTSSLTSTIGRKVVTAVTGLFLIGFVIVHMLGNLSYFVGQDAYNSYAHKLMSLGPLLYLVEFVLLGAFLFHAYFAIAVAIRNKKARPVGYKKTGNAGKPSRKTISSKSMIYTGLILLVFTVIHLKSFKYGTYYEVQSVDGTVMRDLYKLVTEKFQAPWYTGGYLIAMILLGVHLRHAFWSAFQSLGASYPRISGLIYSIGGVLAVGLVVGFLLLPAYIFLNRPISEANANQQSRSEIVQKIEALEVEYKEQLRSKRGWLQEYVAADIYSAEAAQVVEWLNSAKRALKADNVPLALALSDSAVNALQKWNRMFEKQVNKVKGRRKLAEPLNEKNI